MSESQQHCPGFEGNKNLKAIMCKCQNCDKEVEIFSDELDRVHKCTACGEQIDISKCQAE